MTLTAVRLVEIEYSRAPLFFAQARQHLERGERLRVTGTSRETLYKRLWENGLYCSVVNDKAGGWIVSTKKDTK